MAIKGCWLPSEGKTRRKIILWRHPLLVGNMFDIFFISKYLVGKDIYMEATILPFTRLDHWPINIDFNIKANPKIVHFSLKASIFCTPTSKKYWKNGGRLQKELKDTLCTNFRHVKLQLRKWKKTNFGNILELKQDLEEKINLLQ